MRRRNTLPRASQTLRMGVLQERRNSIHTGSRLWPFEELLISLGIDDRQYSWKELRHTTATLMHLRGAEIKSIKDQLRHTSIKMAEGFYIGSDVNYQRKQNEKLTLNSGKIVGNDEFLDFTINE